MVAAAPKSIGVGVPDAELAFICVTRLFTTALTACVAVVPVAGAPPAMVSTVATWAAAFWAAKAFAPVADKGS